MEKIDIKKLTDLLQLKRNDPSFIDRLEKIINISSEEKFIYVPDISSNTRFRIRKINKITILKNHYNVYGSCNVDSSEYSIYPFCYQIDDFFIRDKCQLLTKDEAFLVVKQRLIERIRNVLGNELFDEQDYIDMTIMNSEKRYTIFCRNGQQQFLLFDHSSRELSVKNSINLCLFTEGMKSKKIIGNTLFIKYLNFIVDYYIKNILNIF